MMVIPMAGIDITKRWSNKADKYMMTMAYQKAHNNNSNNNNQNSNNNNNHSGSSCCCLTVKKAPRQFANHPAIATGTTTTTTTTIPIPMGTVSLP